MIAHENVEEKAKANDEDIYNLEDDMGSDDIDDVNS